MNERIDHAAEASEFIEKAKSPNARKTLTYVGIARAEATLALVEQQRIANLIALAGAAHSVLSAQCATDAATALTEWNDHKDPDSGGWHEFRPGVREALGL